MNSLSKYFSGVAAKRLSAVEIDPTNSNQHEFNATVKMKEIFGSERTKFNTTFIYLSDNEEHNINQTGQMTWYDARENHPKRSEYRFYYSANEVINKASVDDIMIIAKTTENSVVIIVAPNNSTSADQLLWLFDINKLQDEFIIKDLTSQGKELEYAEKYIVTSLGFESIEEDQNYLEVLLQNFKGNFPTTSIFSQFSRQIAGEVDPINQPDLTLLKWMETEQILFKTLEAYLVKQTLKEGFGANNDDVDAFIKFSLSVQNRRKSRAGAAFEHHIASILDHHQINYSRQAQTERQNTPDFLFPSITQYKDPNFPVHLLTMLGLKTSAKERWSQILTEADRIARKHLITLEPAISPNQTDEMRAKRVQLIIPGPIINTYQPQQREQIMSLENFITEVKSKHAA